METQTSMSIAGQIKTNANTGIDTAPLLGATAGEDTSFAKQLSAMTVGMNNVTPALINMNNLGQDFDSGSNTPLALLTDMWGLQSAHTQVNSDSPKQFVHSLAGPAKLAADELGVNKAVVIAIAALETGWGKHVIESKTGNTSNNLFGIKASAVGSHKTITASTSEYLNGVKHTLKEPFRAYQSITESVADFAHFIKSNPRYARALSKAGDANAFIDQIHLAGYATDPDYAAKVKNVLRQVERIMSVEAPPILNKDG